MWELIFLLVAAIPVLIFIFGAWLAWWYLSGRHSAEARRMKNELYNLNPLKGKTLQQIESVIGPASSRVIAGENRIMYSWTRQKYDVALVFEGDVCQGVVSEVNV